MYQFEIKIGLRDRGVISFQDNFLDIYIGILSFISQRWKVVIFFTFCVKDGKLYQRIETDTKWTPFRHFEMHFLDLKLMNLDRNFTEVCSYGSNQQYPIIGLDNGWAPTRRQATFWPYDG